MIEFLQGNILNDEAEALVNTVNCVGVMGRGIALQFKKAFPENFKQYAKACKLKEVVPGRMFVFETGLIAHPRYIINFPTKRHWRGKSRIEDIESGLGDLVNTIQRLGIRSIAVPPLGSGLGGLNWNEVRPMLEHTFANLESVRILVYEPIRTTNSEAMKKIGKTPNMTAGRAALIGLMDNYLSGFLDPFITLLEVHKLMYFLQEAGQPLDLKYKKHYYGPYAENLRHVLNHIEGHWISGYQDGGDNPAKHLELIPGAIEEATSFLMSKPDTQQKFAQVTTLVKGFESSFGLELLATVHFVVKYEGASNFKEVVEKTYAWNQRKKQFTERQILIALRQLAENNWINRKFCENEPV